MRGIQFKQQMVYPLVGYSLIQYSYTVYQAVIAGQLIATLGLFIFLQALHFCLWGHEEEIWLWKKQQGEDADLQPLPPSEWKWDQKGWNMYFAILFGNHICGVFLPLTFTPNLVACAMAYVHFVCYIGILINSIFVNEKKKGRGGKTTVNRVFWFIMCCMNLALMVVGMLGIKEVLSPTPTSTP